MSNRVEEACKLYEKLGKRWKKGDKIFLWRTHTRTFHVPPRTQTWEQVLDRLYQQLETNEPWSTIHNPIIQSEATQQGQDFTCTIRLFEDFHSQPMKTLTAVNSYCPLCFWDYQTIENFSKHWKRIHTIFRWKLEGANLIEGYFKHKVDMFQLLEYVDEVGHFFSSYVTLGWKQEQCELMALNWNILAPTVKNGKVYFSTMKFATSGMDVWKMAEKTTKALLEQFVEHENISYSSSSQPMNKTEKDAQVSYRRISKSPTMKKNVVGSSSSKSSKTTKDEMPQLKDRTYYHTVTLHPVAPDEMDRDSESDYSEEWKEELETQWLETEILSHRTRVFFQLWNSFVRKNRVIADFQLPIICEQFVQEHSKDIVQWDLFHLWRMHLLNLFEYGLIQRADIVKCCQPLIIHQSFP
ncbi:Polycomb protein Su(z)12 [Galdieria sulphuraria]|uniref:Polycomb protein SUZ12 n=1 Tax=Galdieria sulphuraria TaxID=130081 RepID=M2XJ23_GALSU|nr:polycomb protein SUZ12 [Galdieria sulphuraria]EME30107.1 polycomb protein SUZ12 [Galdieria sulphuraria]GJD11570.1 Polycomb protein Su(z)12 [Galdieria sulphuraria]|eukprot:XP_005706627.1 polycomb protein SUZ12 [Galdieria sulphuraria]